LLSFAVFLLMLSFSGITLSAQNNSTVNTAKKMISEGEQKEAYRLLKSYTKYTEDGWALWLLGSVSNELRRPMVLRKSYKEAIRLFPENDILKYDYAEKLMAQGKLSKMKRVLKQIEDDSLVGFKNHLLEAQLSFWTGDLDNAQKELDYYNDNTGASETVNQLNRSIRKKKSYILGFQSSITTDDQPLLIVDDEVSVSKYVSNYLQPSVSAGNIYIGADSTQINAYKIGLSNLFLHAESGLRVNVNFVLTAFDDQNMLIGGKAKISRQFWDRITISADASRKRYYSTIQSMFSFVAMNSISESLTYQNKRLMFTISNTDVFYNDKNRQSSQACWLMATLVKHKRFELNAGGAFVLSGSGRDSYGSDKTISQIMEYYSSDDYVYGVDPELTGGYKTYYSPMNEKALSGFGNFWVKPLKKLTLNASASYGFKASADVPFLYLGADSDGSPAVVKEYASVKFKPMDLKGGISWDFDENSRIGLMYEYSKPNVFYNSQTAYLQVRFGL